MTLENQYDETDARLTAYAFGELEGEDLAAMEAAVAADPLLALRVEELRAFGGELGAALADEPVPASAGAASAAPRGQLLRFPAWGWAAGGIAAAASVAIWISSRDPAIPAKGDESASVDPLPSVVEVAVAPQTPVVAVDPEPPSAAPEVAVKTDPEPNPIPLPLEPGEKSAQPVPALAVDAVDAPPASAVPDAPPAQPAEKGPASPEPLPVMVVAADSAAAAVSANPPPVRDAETEVRLMLDKGRGQYAAGDIDGALTTFLAVKKINARNREAGYYSARIAQERTLGQRRFGAAAEPDLSGRSDAIEAIDERSTTSSPKRSPRVSTPESDFVIARSTPVSSFPVDYGTPDFAAIRRVVRSMLSDPSLRTDRLGYRTSPVRIEDLINYFPYRYTSSSTPPGVEPEEVFSAHLAVASAPWAEDHRLVRIGIKAVELVSPEERPAANLVFVVDFSGDGGPRSGISLAKASLLKILEGLRPEDRVAIVTFGGGAKLTFPSTPVSRRGEIQAAIMALKARGFTPARPGIAFAYDVAQEHLQPESLNRVILCTESSALIAFSNDGRTKGFHPTPTFELAREKARGGVFLHVLGFEYSPFTDHAEKLAESGNGIFRRIASTDDARQVVVGELDGTLAPVARDVEVQVEFNPERVASYRLIGYDSRNLSSETNGDGGTDPMGAVTVASGHTVTALYEIDPVKKRSKRRAAAGATTSAAGEPVDQLLTVRIRHQSPLDGEGRTQIFSLKDEEVDFKDADEDFRFAASVAAWGMLFRQSPYAGTATFDAVRKWADDCRDFDPGEYRKDFVALAKDSRVLERRR